MWTAIVLGCAIVGSVAVYVFFAAQAVTAGASWVPWAIGLPFVYLAIPLAFTVFWGILARRWCAPPPRDRRLSIGQWLRLYFREFAALTGSAPKMVAYRLLLREPPPAPAADPILLVHGLGCNAGVWMGFSRHLEARGHGPVYTLSYGPPLASIGHFAEQLAVRIGEVRAATGAEKVTLVTHSMGGLVARAYLRRHGGGAVRLLLTIGAPHRGSRHATLMFGTALAQMRPGSAFLESLNAAPPDQTGAPIISLWSWQDTMVTPQTSSLLPGADNIAVSGIAHNALLADREVWDRVTAEIRRGRPGPGGYQ